MLSPLIVSLTRRSRFIFIYFYPFFFCVTKGNDFEAFDRLGRVQGDEINVQRSRWGERCVRLTAVREISPSHSAHAFVRRVNRIVVTSLSRASRLRQNFPGYHTLVALCRVSASCALSSCYLSRNTFVFFSFFFGIFFISLTFQTRLTARRSACSSANGRKKWQWSIGSEVGGGRAGRGRFFFLR